MLSEPVVPCAGWDALARQVVAASAFRFFLLTASHAGRILGIVRYESFEESIVIADVIEWLLATRHRMPVQEEAPVTTR